MAPAPEEDTIDLVERKGPKRASMVPIDQHSEVWAKVAKPFAQFVFLLVGLVIVVPFVLLCVTRVDREALLDWAKTVLPPVVGFGSAVVGYYFGTRSSNGAAAGDGGEHEQG